MNNLNNQNNIKDNPQYQMGPYEQPVPKGEIYQETTQNYSTINNTTVVNKPLLPEARTFDYGEEEEISFGEEVKKKSNLLFEEKQVSAFKLYCHLSGTYEIILMILGTITALGAGVAAPLMCYFFGDMANDFGSVNVDDDQVETLKQLIKCKNQEEINALAGGNPDKIWIYTIIYNKATVLYKKFDGIFVRLQKINALL